MNKLQSLNAKPWQWGLIALCTLGGMIGAGIGVSYVQDLENGLYGPHVEYGRDLKYVCYGLMAFSGLLFLRVILVFLGAIVLQLAAVLLSVKVAAHAAPGIDGAILGSAMMFVAAIAWFAPQVVMLLVLVVSFLFSNEKGKGA